MLRYSLRVFPPGDVHAYLPSVARAKTGMQSLNVQDLVSQVLHSAMEAGTMPQIGDLPFLSDGQR